VSGEKNGWVHFQVNPSKLEQSSPCHFLTADIDLTTCNVIRKNVLPVFVGASQNKLDRLDANKTGYGNLFKINTAISFSTLQSRTEGGSCIRILQEKRKRFRKLSS
jgi:hypothetical protein